MRATRWPSCRPPSRRPSSPARTASSWKCEHPQEAPEMKRRMHRLLGEDGRILIVAMDHTSFMDSTVEGLARYGETCRSVVPAGADAFLSPIGSIIKYAEATRPAAAIASLGVAPPFFR